MAVLTAEPLGLVISQSQTALVFASISARHFVLQVVQKYQLDTAARSRYPKENPARTASNIRSWNEMRFEPAS